MEYFQSGAYSEALADLQKNEIKEFASIISTGLLHYLAKCIQIKLKYGLLKKELLQKNYFNELTVAEPQH